MSKATEAVMKKLAELLGGVAEKFDPAVANEKLMAAKLTKTDTDGKILKCRLTVARKPGTIGPHLETVNEEIFWIPRGVPVVVPWYVVEQMKNNVERRFRQEPDPDNPGRKRTVSEDIPSESFQYTAINPAEGVEI
jgi:hypothetical protein